MLKKISKKELDREYKIACKEIKQANKGMKFPVKINPLYDLLINGDNLTMSISYLDGEANYLGYNISL